MNVAAFLTAIVPFAVVMLFTPGPNNLMLASSGARFGFVRTLPHQAGIVVGFTIMTLAVGLGIAALIAAVPGLHVGMRIASVGYMLWMAWQIATAEGAPAVAAAARPMGFLAAAAFQWINPKAWIMALSAVATYTDAGHDLRPQILLLAAVFAVVTAAAVATWAAFGQLIRRHLTSPRRRIVFNRTMAVLLLASIAPVIFNPS